MTRYIVRQMAEVWYETTVEATDPNQAIRLAMSPNSNLDWEQMLEATEFTDNWEVEDENGEDVTPRG